MSKHIYIIAGEASGDFLGAQLMKALREKNTYIQFSGIGGELMKAQGLTSLFPMDDLSVMGLAEVLPRIGLLLKRIKQTTEDIEQKRPDSVITIDAPDFCYRVIKRIKKRSKTHPEFIHYVAPTVWAWRPKRAEKISKFLDGLICLFDFEPPYFEKEGLKSIAVGHPMMESGLVVAKPIKMGEAHSIKLGVFLGSRQGEIKRISPVILEAVQKIVEQAQNIELIVPTLPRLKDQVEALFSDITVPVHVVANADNKWSVFKSCDAAVAVSGTVGLELAACNVPHVIAYKMNNLTAMIVRRLIKTKYAHLANIIMGRKVVPEFIQENCEPNDIVNEVLFLLDDKASAQEQRAAFEVVRAKIGSGVKTPSQQAAEFILNN